MDLTKYFAMRPMVEADLQLAYEELQAAELARDAAQDAYDAAATRLKHLQAVATMFQSMMPPPTPPIEPPPVETPIP